jgi:Domain of unknown function (DUF4177)
MKTWKTVCVTGLLILACVAGMALKPVAAAKTYRIIQVQRKNNTGPEVEKILNDAAKEGWELIEINIEENKVTDFIMAK